MSISHYLYRKYRFADNADIPTEFLCEELLLDETELVPILKQMLPIRQQGEQSTT